MSASESKKSVIAAVAGNLAVATVKFVAAAMTGSSAMLSEALHSTVDTGNGGLLLWGMHRSRLPADAQHPFGHGRELYFWSMIVALSIFAVGGGLSMYEGALRIAHPEPVEQAIWSYSVLACAFLFESISLYYGWRAFRKEMRGRRVLQTVHETKDPSAIMIFLEDSAALTGLVIAAAGVLCNDQFGLLWADGVASVLIGVLLVSVAGLLGYETYGLLIGEGLPRETVQRLRGQVEAEPGVAGVDKLLTIHLAPDEVLAAVELRLEEDLDASALKDCLCRVDHMLRSRQSAIKRIYFAGDSLWNAPDRGAQS